MPRIPTTHSKTAATDELKRCVLFRDLSDAQLTVVMELVEPESFVQGAEILEEGRIFPALWVLTGGRCEVVKNCGNGTAHQLAVLEPAGVFGEMSFFEPGPHSATVRALTPVDTVRLSREAFDRLREQSPDAGYKIVFNLVTLLSERLRRMDNWACRLNDGVENGSRFAEWREFQSKLYGDWSF